MSAHYIGKSPIKDILVHYPFYNGHIDEVVKIPTKIKNLNSLVTIGEHKWVIKRYLDTAEKKRLTEILEFQLELGENKVHLAAIEKTVAGMCLLELNNELYTVHQWVDGKHYHYSNFPEKAIVSLAHELAKIHQIGLIKFKDPEFKSGLSPLSARQVLNNITSSKKYTAQKLFFRKFKIKKSKFDLWIIKKHKKYIELAIQLQSSDDVLSLSGEPQCYLHNDINLENLIYAEDSSLNAIIDFDNLKTGPQLFDVSYAAAIIAIQSMSKVTLFLDAYTSHFDTVFDKKSIGFLMTLKCLASLNWSITMYLNGEIKNSKTLESWCYYLDEGLQNIVNSEAFCIAANRNTDSAET